VIKEGEGKGGAEENFKSQKRTFLKRKGKKEKRGQGGIRCG